MWRWCNLVHHSFLISVVLPPVPESPGVAGEVGLFTCSPGSAPPWSLARCSSMASLAHTGLCLAGMRPSLCARGIHNRVSLQALGWPWAALTGLARVSATNPQARTLARHTPMGQLCGLQQLAGRCYDSHLFPGTGQWEGGAQGWLVRKVGL